MPDSRQSGSALPGARVDFTYPPLDETSAQITRDHAEGKESVTVTRATARALYYALFDTLNVVSGREHEPQDVLRLDRMIATLGSIGWPPEDDGA